MITAIDSCVLIDILSDDTSFAERSIAAVSEAQCDGKLIICDLVITEITPTTNGLLEDFLTSLEIFHIPTTREIAHQAGKTYTEYLKRGGKGGRVVPDFIIAHHAIAFADRLLTRDKGFQRDYFKKLNLWYPES